MRLIIVVACLLTAAIAYAQPSNDECINAINVPVTATGVCTTSPSYPTVGATQSMPGCIGTAEEDTWFKFTATKAEHVIRFSYVYHIAPVFEVFSGTCGSLVSIKCTERRFSDTATSDIVTGLTPGSEYYIRFYEKGNNSVRNALRVCVFEPVVNDECAGAILVPVNSDTSWSIYTSGVLQHSTASLTACTSFNGGDLWYKFIATDSVQLFDNRALPPSYSNYYGATYQVYEGSCGALTELRFTNAGGSPGVLCRTTGTGSDGAYQIRGLVAGNTYYIRVMWNKDQFPGMDFRFALSNVPVNDICTNAIDLPVNPGNHCIDKVAGNYKNATAMPMSNSTCVLNSRDVWYKFTATAAKHIISLRTDGVNPDRPLFEVFNNTCGNLQSIYCSGGFDKFKLGELSGLTAGAQYFIRLTRGGEPYNFNEELFELCITTPGPVLPGENCADAVTLLPSDDDYVLNGTEGATGPNTAIVASCPDVGKDIWYQFTPAVNSSIVIRVGLPNTDSLHQGVLRVFTGTCGALTTVNCNGQLSYSPSVGFTGLGGQTYYIRFMPRVNHFQPLRGGMAIYVSALAALPVTIQDFRIVRATTKSIDIVWNTVQESKILTYHIERSSDGAGFKEIAFMNARNQAVNEYTFTDVKPLPGRNYYRLKILDIDGNIEYSRIIDASVKRNGNFNVYVSGGSIRIQNDHNNSVKAMLNIYDETGRQLMKRDVMLKPGINVINKPVSASGTIAFVHLSTEKDREVFKVVF